MNTLLLINWGIFLIVTIYALLLFLKAVGTRIAFIRLGKKTEFDLALKERLKDIVTIVFGQSKLLKDKKSGIIHVLMFYGFILVQFGAIYLFIKRLAPENHLPYDSDYPAYTFFLD